MSHHKAGPSFHHPLERLLYADLRAGVDGGRGFVQDQHRRQAEHDAADAQKLLLSLGQASSVLLDHRVVSSREPADEAVRVRLLCRADHLLLRGVRPAHEDVFPDGAALQPGILQHHAVGAAETLPGHPADICAVHPDAPSVHIVETHKQVDQRRLPASGGAYDGNPLSRFYRQVQILDQRLVLRVGKAHMLKLHRSGRVLKLHCVGSVRNLGRLLDQFKNAGRACQRILKLRDHAGNIVERLCILVGITQKRGQTTHGDCPSDGRQRSGQRHARIDHVVHEPRPRVGQGGVKNRFQRTFFQPAVDLVKFILYPVFHGESLDHLLVPDHLVDQARLLRPGLRLQAEHIISMSGYEFCHKK